MKRFLQITVVVFALVLGSSLLNKSSAQYDNPGGGDVSYQNFYDELSPYGDWIEYPGYGYVWQPQVGEDFRPYSSGGQWVYNDDYEWMWVSDYDWGWAPFHYGRWFEDDYYGWLWQPGYEWSPAWVAWRDGGDYYGWAPLRPGINISIGFNIGSYNPPYDYWCFAPRRYITSHNIYDYCVDRRQNYSIINLTVVINNFNYGRNVFRTGPRRFEAERYCGPIRSVGFRQTYTAGRTQFRNNEVSIYRPNIRRDNNRSFAPRQFNRYDNNGGGNRNGRNNNSGGFRNNNSNNGQRNNEVVRGNNFPNRQGRNNNEVRTPQNNNGSNDRRVDRNNNNNNGQTIPDTRNGRQNERRTDANNNPGNGSPNGRRFDRNTVPEQTTNEEVRTPRRTERPDMNQGNNNRQFERRNNNDARTETRQQQPERRFSQQPQQTPVQQPRQQMEQRRMEQPRTQQQEQRRVEQPRQQRTEQPRQMERRNDNPRPQAQQQSPGNSDGNRGNRGGREF